MSFANNIFPHSAYYLISFDVVIVAMTLSLASFCWASIARAEPMTGPAVSMYTKAEVAQAAHRACEPTPADSLGPFYKSNAPVRSMVGKGYVLNGQVKSSRDCSAIPDAQIEFWLVGPDGKYDDDHRATVFSDKSGGYRFESNAPIPYSGRPAHIHVRVSAPGYKTLVTQHYPQKDQTETRFDLVIAPLNGASG